MLENIWISKFLVFLNISFTSQTRINAYILILEKDFQICKREKSICCTKITCFSR